MTQSKQLWTTIQQPNPKLSLLWNSRTLETRLNNQCYSQPQQSYYSAPPAQYLPRSQYPNHYYQSAPQPIQQQRLIQHNQFTPQNYFLTNNNRFNSNNQLTTQNSNQHRPTHYHTQPSYLTISEESNFQQTALFEDIFPFEFEANESPSLLSNVAVNKQKAITTMYTEAEVEGKPICLILDSGSAKSIIIYQLMQQLQRTVDRPAQTVIIMTDSMKKTLVGEIDNFPFTIDGIIIPVKVLVIDAPQYQALIRNNWLLKANANLDWETQELKISYQGQHTIVFVTCETFNKQSEKAPVLEFEEEKEMPLTEIYMALGLTSNWAEETEQKIFEESRE
ncbi:hypothetical protein G9A89_013301 [Geosiphon pyriformis]|nr:hypothetical protein G9A89_013301 [Geosiphon pyriformis]